MPAAPSETGSKDEEETNSTLEREQEVWDAFREEHYEGMWCTSRSTRDLEVVAVIEQLPLTLHRQFSLLRELDEQVHGAERS
jgi:hypothetical protein